MKRVSVVVSSIAIAACVAMLVGGGARSAQAHSGNGTNPLRKCIDFSPFMHDGTQCHTILLTNGAGSPPTSQQSVTVTYANGTTQTSNLILGQSTPIETNVTQVTVHEVSSTQSTSQITYGHPAP